MGRRGGFVQVGIGDTGFSPSELSHESRIKGFGAWSGGRQAPKECSFLGFWTIERLAESYLIRALLVWESPTRSKRNME